MMWQNLLHLRMSVAGWRSWGTTQTPTLLLCSLEIRLTSSILGLSPQRMLKVLPRRRGFHLSKRLLWKPPMWRRLSKISFQRYIGSLVRNHSPQMSLHLLTSKKGQLLLLDLKRATQRKDAVLHPNGLFISSLPPPPKVPVCLFSFLFPIHCF